MSEKIQKEILKLKIDTNVIVFDKTTKTAKDAATALNCDVAQIVKSIVFKGKNSQKPILILVSGVNRVDEKNVGKIIGEEIEKADADFVKEKTGFAIGGVSPIGHKNDIDIFFDEDLLKFDIVWAAAGTSNSVFKINPKVLLEVTNAKIIDVK